LQQNPNVVIEHDPETPAFIFHPHNPSEWDNSTTYNPRSKHHTQCCICTRRMTNHGPCKRLQSSCAIMYKRLLKYKTGLRRNESTDILLLVYFFHPNYVYHIFKSFERLTAPTLFFCWCLKDAHVKLYLLSEESSFFFSLKNKVHPTTYYNFCVSCNIIKSVRSRQFAVCASQWVNNKITATYLHSLAQHYHTTTYSIRIDVRWLQ
jgi:hypothetical protein